MMNEGKTKLSDWDTVVIATSIACPAKCSKLECSHLVIVGQMREERVDLMQLRAYEGV